VRAEIILVASAFFHSSWNFIFKRLNPKHSVLLLIVTTATLTSVCLAPLTGGLRIGTTLGFVFTITAGLFEAGYFHSLSRTYETAPFGISYSIMRGGAMLLVTIISVLFLSEPLSSIKLIGMSLLVLGIFLTPSKDKDTISRSGFFWALSCSVFIAGYHIFYGLALAEGVTQVGLFALSMLTSVPFLALKSRAIALKDIKKIDSKSYRWIIFAGILSGGSFILFLYGLKNSYAGVAISLRNTSILFSQGFAWWLGERLTKVQWLGISAIFLGALLIGQ
jgi:drug/metabolite transporter (DMT)-like permease